MVQILNQKNMEPLVYLIASGRGQKIFASIFGDVTNEPFLLFWSFCQNYLSWGSSIWKPPKLSNIVRRWLQLLTCQFWVREKQTFISGFIGHLKLLWIFISITWKQGLNMRPTCYSNIKDTPMYQILCFSSNGIVLIDSVGKKANLNTF